MTDPTQEFIDDFLSHAFYDPVKRRLYYLKNRKLKGRKKGKSSKGKRISESQEKIIAARQRAKKLSPAKRNAVEKKLDAAQNKLNKIKRKVGKTVDGAIYTPKEWWADGPKKYDEKRRKQRAASNGAAKVRFESIDRQHLEVKKERDKIPRYKMITKPSVYTKNDNKKRKLYKREWDIRKDRWNG